MTATMEGGDMQQLGQPIIHGLLPLSRSYVNQASVAAGQRLFRRKLTYQFKESPAGRRLLGEAGPEAETSAAALCWYGLNGNALT